jgi:hypothetical protein
MNMYDEIISLEHRIEKLESYIIHLKKDKDFEYFFKFVLLLLFVIMYIYIMLLKFN